MDLIKKLDECENRFKVVSDLVMDPNLVKDAKKYKDTMREHGYLSEVCALYDEYKKVLSGIQDAKEMITAEDDADMREMAREELKELEERQPALEEEIKLKLVPPDPLDEKNIILVKEVKANEKYILEQIEKRAEAKKNKDFSLADAIRDNLLQEGIRLVDSREGTTYELL